MVVKIYLWINENKDLNVHFNIWVNTLNENLCSWLLEIWKWAGFKNLMVLNGYIKGTM
jgi:hypothetical protein